MDKMKTDTSEEFKSKMYGVPYFTFRNDSSKNSLILRIYLDNIHYPKVHFQIDETCVSVFSSKRCEKCLIKIRLPVKVHTSTEVPEETYLPNLQCYQLVLHKRENNVEDRTSLTAGLDVISPHLSWEYNFQEEPYLITSQKQRLEDEISASLLEKLSLKDNVAASTPTLTSSVGFYGFASRYRNQLKKHSEEDWLNVMDCKNPDSSDSKTRHRARWEMERQDFSIDHYLADYFFENEDESPDSDLSLIHYISYRPYWYCIDNPDDNILTSKQMLILAGLSCKNFQLFDLEHMEVLLSLFDIVLAYAYDYRINSGVFSSESAWNISKLSSTFSWLQTYRSPYDVTQSFFRRCLTYPLIRHWFLCKKALMDALAIFNLGRRQLLNCLVSIYELFDDTVEYRIFNTLYLEDYLIWIQQVHPQTISNFTESIKSTGSISKEDVFSSLPGIEATAINMLQEDDEGQYLNWSRCLKDVELLMKSPIGYTDDLCAPKTCLT